MIHNYKLQEKQKLKLLPTGMPGMELDPSW
jgi:hypothetical protein